MGNVDDANILAAALLHDTVEDTATTSEEIAAEFGAEVQRLVAEVTDDKGLVKQARKDAQVAHAPHLSPGAKIIKLADKISNVREIGVDPPVDWTDVRRAKYFDWAERVVTAMGRVNPELEALFGKTVNSVRGNRDRSGSH